MAGEGFKIATGYVEVVGEIERDEMRRSAEGAGDEAGEVMGDRLTRGLDGKLRDHRGRFANEGRSAGEGLGAAMGSSAGRTLGGVLSGHLPTIFSNPYILGAAAAAGALLAPAIGAGIAGGLIGGVGLGAIAGGFMLVADSPKIAKAASSLKKRFMDIDTTDLEANILAAQERLAQARKSKNKDAIKEAKADLRVLQSDLDKAQAYNEKNFSLKDAAGPLIEPFVSAMKIFEDAAGRVIPKVGKMFAQLDSSGAIPALATGLVSLVENALPGMLKMVEASGPFLKSLGPGLAEIGKGIGFFGEQVALAGPDATVFFADLFRWLAGVISFTGLVIRGLSSAYVAIRNFFTSIPGWVSAGAAGFMSFWNGVQTRGSAVIAWFGALPGRIGGVLSSLPARARAVFWRMFDMVTTGIGTFIGTAIRLFLTLPPRAAGALITLPARVMSIISSARSRALGAAAQLVAGVVNLLQTLPGRAAGAVSSFGSRVVGVLRGAVGAAHGIGADIISGIIGGINSMIGAAVGAAKRAVGNIVSGAKSALGIGSPSRVMAREVGRWMLPGVTAGMQSTIPAAQRAVGAAVGSLVPGVAGAGGSAGSGALSGPGGGTNYYFAPGSIVIDASKLRSIEELMAMINGLQASARAFHARTVAVGARA